MLVLQNWTQIIFWSGILGIRSALCVSGWSTEGSRPLHQDLSTRRSSRVAGQHVGELIRRERHSRDVAFVVDAGGMASEVNAASARSDSLEPEMDESWHMGALGQSCDQACVAAGGTCDLQRLRAVPDIRAVALSLGAPCHWNGTRSNQWWPAIEPSLNNQCFANTATTGCGSSYPSVKRFCACQAPFRWIPGAAFVDTSNGRSRASNVAGDDHAGNAHGSGSSSSAAFGVRLIIELALVGVLIIGIWRYYDQQKQINALPKGAFEHQRFRDVYEVEDKLGEGAFGVIYEVYERKTGGRYAAKMIDLAESDMDCILEEVAILNVVQHPTLTVCNIDQFQDACFFYIVMPMYAGGDLTDGLERYIAKHGLPSEALFWRTFAQMSAGISFVHSKKVVHRDIKPDNFLMATPDLSDSKNSVVIADFGLSIELINADEVCDEICGTPSFQSPEILRSNYSFPADIFALGLTAHILQTGEQPFKTQTQIMKWDASEDGPPMPAECSKPCRHLYTCLLDRDPALRASADTVVLLVQQFSSCQMRKSFSDQPVSQRGKTRVNLKDNAEIHMAVKDRRRRMVFELNMQANPSTARLDTDFSATESFTLKQNRYHKKFEWFEWDHNKRLSGTFMTATTKKQHTTDFDTFDPTASFDPLSSFGANPAMSAEDGEAMEQRRALPSCDIQLIKDVLRHYKVELGSEAAKRVEDLALECRLGKSTLAEEEGKLLRVVDVVVPVLESPNGLILVEKHVHFSANDESDGKLPGTKRLPWESTQVTALRALAALEIGTNDVDWGEKSVQIQKEVSPSYPGMCTIYRRHLVPAKLVASRISENRLKSWGLPAGTTFTNQTNAGSRLMTRKYTSSRLAASGGRTLWGWKSRQFCQEHGIFTQSDPTLGMRYMELLPVRTNKVHEQNIADKLEKCGMDPSKFDDEALERLAVESRLGESNLVEQLREDGSKTAVRVTGVTVLRIINEEGKILVEEATSQDHGQTWKDGGQLPGTKQRLQENPYMAARRLLTSELMLHEDSFTFDVKEGGGVIEETESRSFPGLTTIYDKSLIQVRLLPQVMDKHLAPVQEYLLSD